MPFIKTITDEQRLFNNRRIDDNGCWVWTGFYKKETPKKKYLPYGFMHIGSRTDKSQRLVQVHRVAASLWKGLDLKKSEIHVLHSCDNPRCFNPEHLFFGDNISNVADRHAKGRDARQCGESSPNCRLTDLQVAEIRSLKGSATHRVIAGRFGVTRSHISAILAGRMRRETNGEDPREKAYKITAILEAVK